MSSLKSSRSLSHLHEFVGNLYFYKNIFFVLLPTLYAILFHAQFLQCSATRPQMLAITDLMILLWRRPYLDAKIQNGILSGFLRIERVHI